MTQIARRLLDPSLASAVVAALSAAVLVAALLMQHVGGLAPCPLCVLQRWPYVATLALGLVALLPALSPAGRRALLALAALAFFTGAGIAFYHTGVEQGWFAAPSSCTGVGVTGDTVEELRRKLMAAPVVRCDEVPWSLFGISIAGYNTIVAAALGVYAAAAAALRPRSR